MVSKKRIDQLMAEWRKQTLIELRRDVKLQRQEACAALRTGTYKGGYNPLAAVMAVKLSQQTSARKRQTLELAA
jgi:hypothetical protein